ncbi:MAG: hypothetical protein IJ262_05425 [Clostridia bacterium]|nr:hypothetical protein [Clostridia bacterium]
MEKFLKNKKVIIIVGAIIAVVCVIIAFLGSGSIYGAWEVSERSINENLNNYPENDFVLYENGSFTCDGVSGTYSINDDIITLNISIFGAYTYEYDVSNDTLMLRNIDDEDNAKIYYDRVS